MTDFQKLWVGQAISVFGSLITRTALPWCALLFLHAHATDMALLILADLVPGFLIGLIAGAWLDRATKRPVMIACDLLRFSLVVSIPLLAQTGRLSISYLYLVAPLMGGISAVFDIAYQSYLPELVDDDALARANGRLSASAAVAELCAFSLSGWLVQSLGGPQALFVDGLTFLASALSLWRIRQRDHTPTVTPQTEAGFALFTDAWDGLRIVSQHPVLRALALAQTALSFCMALASPLIMLYVTRNLGLEPRYLGMVFAVGGVTSLLSATFAERIGQRLGVGRATVFGFAAIPLGMLAIPLAPPRSVLGYAVLMVNQVVTDPGWTIFEIHQTTIRQRLAPEAFLSRVNAVTKVGSLGASIVGTVICSLLADRVGPRLMLLASVVATIVVSIFFVLSPVRRATSE